MKFKRIGRVLVCLLLVSALLINASPIKAKATGIGATAAITAASTVLSPAGLVVGATFVALGLAAAANPEGFQNMVDAGVSALESAGTWVKDGMVELLRTEDSEGNASYYVDSGMMEDIRQTSLSSGTVYKAPVASSTSVKFKNYTYHCSAPVSLVCFEYIKSTSDQYAHFKYFLVSTQSFQYDSGSLSATSKWGNVSGNYKVAWLGDMSWWRSSESETIADYQHAYGAHYLGIYDYSNGVTPWGNTTVLDGSYTTDIDVSLGLFPSVPVDGTSARQWSEEYTDRGLKVYGGGSGNNNNDGKWFWKVIIPTTAVTLYAMSQADQWSGETPKEFEDYTTKEELEIVSRPEVDFALGVELAPITSPAPDTGGDTGSDTGNQSGSQTDYSSWFQKIIKGIEELPSKFAEWFNNIASQLERIIEGITTLGQNIAQSLQTLGQNIVEGFRNAISSLFSPSENYLENKVQALKDKHYNLAQFTELGNNLKAFFAGLGSKPPIIYIDLGAATGSYLWGGRQIFLDLTWYAEYKPKMDFILGGIIWLWLAWRVFLAIPGIISGMPGESGSPDISIGTHYIPPIPGQGALPPGQKKRRSK